MRLAGRFSMPAAIVQCFAAEATEQFASVMPNPQPVDL
jgi:hypothetical protein